MNLENCRKAAKKLFKQLKAGDAEAVARIERVFVTRREWCLAHAQHVIAKERGYWSWADLRKAANV